MINDSIEDRIKAWCLSLVSVAWYLVTPLAFWVNVVVIKNKSFYEYTEIGFAVILLFIVMLVSSKFTKWSVAKLTSLLDQEIEVPREMWKYILKRAYFILIATLLISLAIALITGYF